MTAITWLGDSDPAAQAVSQFGYTFVKGEPVNVTDKKVAEKLTANPLFSAEKSAEATKAKEPTAEELAARAEEGTEKGALRARLKDLGVMVGPNASTDTMRQKLADTLKGQDQ